DADYRCVGGNRVQGMTLGGAMDDARGEGTRTAPACHPARPGTGPCQSGLPGGRDFPRRSTAGDIDWSAMVWTVSIPVGIGRVPAARWNWPRDGATAAERGGERRDVGRRPDCRVRGPARERA